MESPFPRFLTPSIPTQSILPDLTYLPSTLMTAWGISGSSRADWRNSKSTSLYLLKKWAKESFRTISYSSSGFTLTQWSLELSFSKSMSPTIGDFKFLINKANLSRTWVRTWSQPKLLYHTKTKNPKIRHKTSKISKRWYSKSRNKSVTRLANWKKTQQPWRQNWKPRWKLIGDWCTTLKGRSRKGTPCTCCSNKLKPLSDSQKTPLSLPVFSPLSSKSHKILPDTLPIFNFSAFLFSFSKLSDR